MGKNLLYRIVRIWAMLKKEFIIIRRDLSTYLFLIIFPVGEVILFGYIINSDPKNMPTMIYARDNSTLTHSIIQSFKDTGYFNIKKFTQTSDEATAALQKGNIQFVINIPENFSRDLVRGEHPHILLEGDASDPTTISGAFSTAVKLPENTLEPVLQGPLNYLNVGKTAYLVDTHAKYNPTLIAQYHTIPGLIVTILTVSLVILTTVGITSEFEQGTMETLLITPLKPIETILGKVIPHITMGYLLLCLTMLIARIIFHVPFQGSFLLLTVVAFPFIISTLCIGLAASSFSTSQFQAVTLGNAFNIPSILFSGFMFPFYAMPIWAQKIGLIFPATHFLVAIKNIMLKGSGFFEVWPEIWPIIIFMTTIILVCVKFYRVTLD